MNSDSFKSGERIMEIAEEIRALLQEAVELVSIGGSELDLERARSYWYPRILIELGGDHMWLGGSMCTMEDSAKGLMADEGQSEDEDD